MKDQVDKAPKVISPEGHEFEVEEEASKRILVGGLPVIIVDIRERRLTAKEGGYFLITDQEGNIPTENTSGLGFFYQDTRFLSCMQLTVNRHHPILLSSTMERDYMAHIELTNADLEYDGNKRIPQETLNVRRLRVIKDGLHERIRVKNYNPFPIKVSVELSMASDFADIFEVRGLRRKSRGHILRPKKLDDQRVVLAYQGEDDVFRQTMISVSLKPDDMIVEDGRVTLVFNLRIKPYARQLINLTLQPLIGTGEKAMTDFDSAVRDLRRAYEEWGDQCTDIWTDNELFNSVVERGQSDLRALISPTPYGPMIEGGIPWFVAPFGRDSIIASMQTLAINPGLAKTTLRWLGKLQGKKVDPWRDEEPGKIAHEFRRGELAQLGTIPHSPYYGSVDTTALYLMLASEYFKWTNDLELLAELRENIEAGLSWIDKYGDRDGDGFIEYERQSPKGLQNQGWKDSHDAVTHLNGEAAEGPIALIEVQGYAYAALRGLVPIFEAWGDKKRAREVEKKAESLKNRINELYWMEDQGYFAMALDGDKNQVKTVTSNPGHCLWTGAVADDKSEAMVRRLLQPDMFSGWGIRTLSKSSKNYNPMSYHNGTVWPHDNGIIVAGLKRYGFLENAGVVARGLFETATHTAYYRLPELFCGFARRGNNWPVSYPVACSPTAWSAGSMFHILTSLLGLVPDAPNGTLMVNRPSMPKWLDKVRLRNLRLGASKIAVSFVREESVTGFSVIKKEGELRIIMEE